MLEVSVTVVGMAWASWPWEASSPMDKGCEVTQTAQLSQGPHCPQERCSVTSWHVN